MGVMRNATGLLELHIHAFTSSETPSASAMGSSHSHLNSHCISPSPPPPHSSNSSSPGAILHRPASPAPIFTRNNPVTHGTFGMRPSKRCCQTCIFCIFLFSYFPLALAFPFIAHTELL